MTFLTAVWNLDGGCGKSSTAHNIAISLAELGKKTLLVEGDSVSPLFNVDWGRDTSKQFSDGAPLKEIAIEAKPPFLHIIPAIKRPSSLLDIWPWAHAKYKRTLFPGAQLKRWNATIVDVRPRFSENTLYFLQTFKLVIVPTLPTWDSIDDMEQSCQMLKEYTGRKPIIWILPFAWNMRRKCEIGLYERLLKFSHANKIKLCKPIPESKTGMYDLLKTWRLSGKPKKVYGIPIDKKMLKEANDLEKAYTNLAKLVALENAGHNFFL